MQEEELSNEVETVGEFTYLGGRVSAGGVCKLLSLSKQDRVG